MISSRINISFISFLNRLGSNTNIGSSRVKSRRDINPFSSSSALQYSVVPYKSFESIFGLYLYLVSSRGLNAVWTAVSFKYGRYSATIDL